MIVALPRRSANDNQINEIWVCPLCESAGFMLETGINDTVLVKCAQCFANVTPAVARCLPIEIDLCKPGT